MAPLITTADRIFVAGHRGMAGSAICRALQRSGYGDPAQGGALLTASREELDLLDAAAVQRWLAQHQPSVVMLAAAKVGGIEANNRYPADFLLEPRATRARSSGTAASPTAPRRSSWM